MELKGVRGYHSLRSLGVRATLQFLFLAVSCGVKGGEELSLVSLVGGWGNTPVSFSRSFVWS